MSASLRRIPMRRVKRSGPIISLALAFVAGLYFPSSSLALEVPVLKESINDFARMMPPVSLLDLEERLMRFRKQTGRTVVVLTIRSLEDEDIQSFGRKIFMRLPLGEKDLPNSVLLLIARKERKVGVQAGSELRRLFPEPEASRKLQEHVSLYFDGFRPDLGIYAGVNYIFRAIQGEVHVGATTEEERLEDLSTRGVGAGAIFAVLLAPFFAFFVGILWGIYATTLDLPRVMRFFMGAVLGGGTGKIVQTLAAIIGHYGDDLWFLIVALSIPLGVLGCLTEFWMSGDWSGIPRVKDRMLRRKPEDKMGI